MVSLRVDVFFELIDLPLTPKSNFLRTDVFLRVDAFLEVKKIVWCGCVVWVCGV